MEKRILAVLSGLLLGLFICQLSVYSSSSKPQLAQAAQQQSQYTLTVTKTRGTIYDTQLTPLTGGNSRWIAAVSPGMETLSSLNQLFPPKEMEPILSNFQSGIPFLLEIPTLVSVPGIQAFSVESRYTPDTLAPHVLGYLDSSGAGVCGIEKGFDTALSQNQGKITATYHVDALQRSLGSQAPEIQDTSYLGDSGVVLTLDARIQEIAQQVGEKYLNKGAVVIAQVPDCSLKAVASFPDYAPDQPATALNAPDSPLLNRAFNAYTVGSIFKLVSAAAALEYGISPDTPYTCSGAILVSQSLFHCFNGGSHGAEDMKSALSNSCNAYFVNLMQMLPSSRFLEMAKQLGFGQELEVAPGCISVSGVLPSSQTLSYPKGLANFSFGQGELTATPIQITALVNTIASGGEYAQPYLYQGLVDASLNYTHQQTPEAPVRILKEKNAQFLQEAMISSAEEGTGRKGNPKEVGGAGVKTATAQTGQYDDDGNEIVQCWYAGFWPAENPQYVITVFAEEGEGGGATCGPVFREIAEKLYALQN